MAKRRGTKSDSRVYEKDGIARVIVSKRLVINIGNYQSYAFEYGIDDVVFKGETPEKAMKRLASDIEEVLNGEVENNVDKVIEMISKNKK